MKHWLALILVLMMGTTTAHATDVRVRPVPLHQHDKRIQSVGKLDYVTGLALTSTHPKFGGWSGMALSADGKRLIAISDKGTVMRADLLERAPGEIAGLANVTLTPLVSLSGFPLKGKSYADSESLIDLSRGALTGPFLVGFERQHRIWRYDDLTGSAQIYFEPPQNADIPDNSGFEAMTLLKDGRLFVMTENARMKHRGNDKRANLGWVLDDQGIQAIGLKRGSRMTPTDATTLPNGDVLLVERHFDPLTGLAIQIKRITVTEIDVALQSGDPIVGDVIALFGGAHTIDNMEALAVRVAPDGGTLLYMMSDDNFNRAQQSLLLVFRLRD